MLRVKDIRIDYEKKLMAVTQMPVFGWALSSDHDGVIQAGYRMQFSESAQFENVVYDSGWVCTDQSAGVVPDFQMEHLCRYYVRVCVRDNYDEYSDWSETADFLYIDLSEPWKAEFITADKIHYVGCTCVGTEFSTRKKVRRAVVMAAALGLYELYLNNIRVGDGYLTPGWTSYHRQLLYQTWDVTEYLKKGVNQAAAVVAPGWYKGRVGETGTNLYGDRTAFSMQLQVFYQDGSSEIWMTDERWKGGLSKIIFTGLYDGETYDARLKAGKYDGYPVEKLNVSKQILFPQKSTLVKRHEILKPVRLFVTPDGRQCADFGQNIAGVPGFSVKGGCGEAVELYCFEELDSDGNVYRDNLRSACQRIRYYCSGDGWEHYEPHFCYQGFRYVWIAKWPSGRLPDQEHLYAVALYSDVEYDGYFSTDRTLVNQLVSNIRWSMKSNFVDIPTDCPQRDERLGWAGDIQIFSGTAMYFGNVYNFLEKWLTTLRLDQRPDGGVPHIIPDILCLEDQSEDWLLSQGTHSAAGWADAAVIIPWKMYLFYGDKRILLKQYDSMKSWIDFMTDHAEDGLWNYKLQFGDWLALDASEGSYFGATEQTLTSTAYYAYSTGLFAKAAGVLENRDDREKYYSLYQNIVRKFQDTFFLGDGSMTSDTQTAYALALCFHLVPEKLKQKVVKKFLEALQKNKGHMTTGFMGTPCLCPALSECGEAGKAEQLFLLEDYPSWLYQVRQGATTIWEHLDGKKPDGTMWSPDMNSFNHYAYGSIGEWLYACVAGIRPDEADPGFHRIIIKPEILDNFREVEAACHTSYGMVRVRWRKASGRASIEIEIPCNTTAELHLKNVACVIESAGKEIRSRSEEKVWEMGSGCHRFYCSMNENERRKL